ncbi:hypothetical protein ABZX93_10550 [Streptomyces sp. NPDC006632]|uniref:hypothetical protein n=1 Tax=unclassified Streptomyces TaxID=2593676 RepID=UPI002E24DD10
MRARRLVPAVVGAALTAVLASGCGHTHAASGTERQMEKKVSDAESAAAAADSDTTTNQ